MEGSAKMLVVAVGPNSQAGIIKTLIMNTVPSTEELEERKICLCLIPPFLVSTHCPKIYLKNMIFLFV